MEYRRQREVGCGDWVNLGLSSGVRVYVFPTSNRSFGDYECNSYSQKFENSWPGRFQPTGIIFLIVLKGRVGAYQSQVAEVGQLFHLAIYMNIGTPH